MKRSKELKEKKTLEAGKKTRFNVIDALIVVLVLSCIAGVVLRYTVLDDIELSKDQKDFYITFTVSSLSHAQLQKIVEAKDEAETNGNWVYLSDGKTELGVLTALDEQNRSTVEFVKENGEVVYAQYSENESDDEVLWTITGKILCRGCYSENGSFLLNGKEYLSANMVLDVFTKYCDFTLTITDIEASLE